MPPPSSFVTIPLRECHTKCAPACAQLDSEVHWSPGARRKLREDRAEREREARSGLRDPTSNTSYRWEDILNLGDPDMEDKGGATGSSSKPSGSFRGALHHLPSSLATRRALKNPLALPCPLPRACTEDDTDEESLFPLPASPRGARSPASRCSKSPVKLGPNNSTTPSPSATGELSTKCADAPDPAKYAEGCPGGLWGAAGQDVAKRRRGLGLEAEDLTEEAILNAAVEDKRRANTVAARRGRQRKLEHVKRLEEELEETKRALDLWKERAIAAEGMVRRLEGKK